MRGGVELFRKANSAILMLLLLFYMRMVFRKPNGVKLYFNDYFLCFLSRTDKGFHETCRMEWNILDMRAREGLSVAITIVQR